MTEQEYSLPIPVADEASQEFFDGAKDGRLMLLQCSQCDRYRLPGRERCADCWSTDTKWTQASGRGKLYTFGVMHQKYHPAFADVTPYNYAIVELEEGPRMVTNLVDVPVEEYEIGMPLEVAFEEIDDEVTLVLFRRRQVEGG